FARQYSASSISLRLAVSTTTANFSCVFQRSGCALSPVTATCDIASFFHLYSVVSDRPHSLAILLTASFCGGIILLTMFIFISSFIAFICSTSFSFSPTILSFRGYDNYSDAGGSTCPDKFCRVGLEG